MKTDRIHQMRDVQHHERCPTCARFIYDRSTQVDVVPDGDPLYTFTETCHNCGWSYSIENVDLGA